ADLLRDAALDRENASYVEAIRSSGGALIALIDEILDLSKIEAGHFDLIVETVNLRKLVESVVELLAPRAQSKGIEIAASISADSRRHCRGRSDLRLRRPDAGMRRPRADRPGPSRRDRPRRRSRSHQRRFAVRGAGHRRAPDRSGRAR